jgi:hypothetical protein
MKNSKATKAGSVDSEPSLFQAATDAAYRWCVDFGSDWDNFWFAPRKASTLALMRICAGWMLFYTHFIWTINASEFLGPHAWITRDVSQKMAEQVWVWTYFWYFDHPLALLAANLVALFIFAAMTVGWKTRYVTVAAWLISLMYIHRLQGSLFGLDQMNVFLAMYLAFAPCGDRWSVDAWLRNRRGQPAPLAKTSATVATRLLQIHLCVIYLFGGISKLQGTMWRDGSAVWFAISNLEYQSLNMTWLVYFPWLIAALSHATVFWETFYCALVWPARTRPFVLAIAVCVHGGIALFLGMPTFGFIMIVANMAFLSPSFVDAVGNRVAGLMGRKAAA